MHKSHTPFATIAFCAVASASFAGGSATWSLQSPRPAGDHVNGVSFVTPDIGFIAGDDRMLMRTGDGGATWSQMPGWERFPWYEGRLGDVFFIDENHGWVAGAWFEHFQRTSDGGATWEEMPPVGDIIDLEFESALVGYALAPGSGLARTSDGGTTWVYSYMPTGEFLQFMDFWNEDRGVLATRQGTEWSLHRTTNGGASWEFVQNSTEYYAVTFIDENTLVWGNFSGAICRSSDFGTTHTVVSTEPLGAWTAARIDDDSMALMDYNYAFWLSEDTGVTWNKTHDGIGLRAAEAFPNMRFLNAQHGWATGESGLVWSTQDGGHNWSQLSQGMGRPPSDIHVYPDGRGVVVGDLLRLQTEDFGATWTSMSALIGNQGGHMSNLDTASATTLATHDTRASMLISHDRGDTWERRDLPFVHQRYLEWVDMVDPEVGYVFGFILECCGLIYKTDDGGATWNEPWIFDHQELQYGQMFDSDRGVALLANSETVMRTSDGWETTTIRNIPQASNIWARMVFATPEVGWAGGQFGRIARTTDGGDSWTISTPAGAYPDYSIQDLVALSETELYIVGADAGAPVRVWHSVDGGATWADVGHNVMNPDDPSQTSAAALAVVPGTGLWTAGFGGFIASNVETGTSCPGDVDGNGAIDFGDLLALLSNWGPCAPPCPEDINGDGAVTFADLLVLLAAWGPCAKGDACPGFSRSMSTRNVTSDGSVRQ